MKYLALLAIFLTLPLAAQQCTPVTVCKASDGGTTIQGPIHTLPGTNATSYWEFTPATSAMPCPTIAQADKTFVFCGQPGIGMTVDLGDGNGYVSLKGPKGDKGDQGLVGQTGAQGPAWSPAGQTFTIKCATFTAAKGGKGVPNFSVTNIVATGCTIQ
jgi:hypothetical protein